MQTCARCGAQVEIEGAVGRSSTCSNCGAYLHSCVNCRFYKPGMHNSCSEPQSEPVADKRSANFCDYFSMKQVRGNEIGGRPVDKKRKAREDFDKLFGG